MCEILWSPENPSVLVWVWGYIISLMTMNKIKCFSKMWNHPSFQLATYNFKNVSKSVTGNFWNVYICQEKIWQNMFLKYFDFTNSTSLLKKKIGERNFHRAQNTDGFWAMQLTLNEKKSLNCSSGHGLVYMSISLLTLAICLRFIRVDSSIQSLTQILLKV